MYRSASWSEGKGVVIMKPIIGARFAEFHNKELSGFKVRALIRAWPIMLE